MLPQPSVILEAMKLLITPGNLTISEDEEEDNEKKTTTSDGLDMILENSLKDYTEKINTDSVFGELNSFWLERKPRYVAPEASLKWEFASACLVLVEALTISLREVSSREKEREKSSKRHQQTTGDVKSTKKSVAPRLPADALSINQQKVFMNTMQFILCLGVYPHLAKGVGIPLERRSGYGLLLTSSLSDIRSILERQFRLVLIARVFSACLDQTSLSYLFLSRYLGDCLTVMFQLCYGVKKANVPKGTTLESSTLSKSDTKHSDNTNQNRGQGKDEQTKVLHSSEVPSETASSVSSSSSLLSSNNNTQETTSIYCIAITEEDVKFCKKFLENLKQRSYQPSLVKELLLLQGGPGPKAIKSLKQDNPIPSNLNLPPAPGWLKNACSQSLNKILLSKPNGIFNIVQGMLDAPISTKTDEIQDYQKYQTIARVVANRPSTLASDEEYFKQIAPQIIKLIRDTQNDQFCQMLHVFCSVMNIVSNKNPCLFEKYFFKELLRPLYSCIEYNAQDRCTSLEQIVVDEFRLNTCIEDIHRIFVSGSGPEVDLLNKLCPFVHILFSIFCYVDVTSSPVRSLTEEILLAYLKFVDIENAMMCLRVFVFGSLSKNWNLGIRLLHPRLTFAVGDNDCPRVIIKAGEETDDEQLDILCDESEQTSSLLNLISKLEKEELTEKFFIYMLQELTQTLNEEIVSEESFKNESSGLCSTELLDIETKQQESTDHVFYQLTILNFLAAVYEKLGPTSLKSTKHVLEFIKATLVKKGIDELDPVEKEFGGIFNNEILTMSLGMLTAIVAGALQMTDEDQKTLKGLIPMLQNVIVTTSNHSIKAMASSLRVAIATYGKVWPGMDFVDVYEKECQQETPSGTQLIKELPDNPHAEKTEESAAKNSKKPSRKNKKSGKKKMVNDSTSSTSKPCPISNKKEVMENITLKNTLPKSQDKPTTPKQTDSTTKSQDNNRSKEPSPQKANSKIPQCSELQNALKETYDPLIPVQGHGLITLTKLVQKKDKEAVKKQDLLLHIFEEKLTHPDSYIYLSAINGLAVMAEQFPEKVIPRLIDLFHDPESEIQNGEAVPSEIRIKLGESIVKTSRNLGPMIPKYRDVLLNAFLQGAKDTDPLVRASSLSNLSEACKLLHFSLGNVIHEIFSCCSSMAKSDSSVEVRAAAVLLITQLLQGLGKDALQVLEFVMKDLYQLLKSIMVVEKEEKVKFHANLALNELSDIMKESLFPKQKLTKKIRVLDPE